MSPGKMKQAKLSSFWSKKTEGKKRKNDENEVVFLGEVKKEGMRVLAEVQNAQLEGIEWDDFEEPILERTKKQKNSDGDVEDVGWVAATYDLTFETPKKCVVVKSHSASPTLKTLLVRDLESGVTGSCRLQGPWVFEAFALGDVLTVSAVLRDGHWTVDSQAGYVSADPDTLVSSTSLVGSMYCLRRGILTHFYRGLEPSNRFMVVGNLVHETLQACLQTKSTKDVREVVDEAVRRALRDILASGTTTEDARKEVQAYVPSIRRFVDFYLNGIGDPNGNFKRRIEDVVDIEENVVATKLGLKGRIDATVKVNGKSTPLEIKTGKTSFSNEHKAQVALYTMMMSEVGEKIDSGLLLYVKEGRVDEMRSSRTEERDLLILRNQFVRALANFATKQTLPDPIRSSGCAKCAYLDICAAFIKNDGLENMSETHPMRQLVDTTIQPSHLNYFIFWTKLILLENGTEDGCDAETRLMNLKLEEPPVPFRDEFKHTFLRRETEGGSRMTPGQYVTVSTASRAHVTSGRILNITPSHCSVVLAKSLQLSDTFRIDLYKSNSILNISLTNLSVLVTGSREELREIVVGMRKPCFEEKIGRSVLNEECLKVLKPLNEQQRRAVLKVITAKDYLLIRGPPGTGKTQTIVALIQVLAGLKQRVLIVGHTHSSVDNILMRLDAEFPFVRFGALRNIHPSLHGRAFETLQSKCSTTEQLAKIYECRTMASTCLGVDSELIAKEPFDVCVVDESSQVLQPEVLRPLICAKKFVLIGDSNQLGPVVRNRDALKLGMDETLFERLENDSSTVSLKLQYRMNRVLNALANNLTYGDQLECGSKEISEATLEIENLSGEDDWLREILSSDIEKSVVFLDTGNYFSDGSAKQGTACSSLIEVGIIRKIAETLVKNGVDEETIGIVAPFRAQVQLLKQWMKSDRIEVNTVDQYQGRDKDVIIYSCTKENSEKSQTDEFELLNNKRRLTVAVTRSKRKLIIVGDRRTIIKYKPLHQLVECLNQSQMLKLQDGVQGFSFSSVSLS